MTPPQKGRLNALIVALDDYLESKGVPSVVITLILKKAVNHRLNNESFMYSPVSGEDNALGVCILQGSIELGWDPVIVVSEDLPTGRTIVTPVDEDKCYSVDETALLISMLDSYINNTPNEHLRIFSAKDENPEVKHTLH